MLAAAERDYSDICNWLCEYGGDAKNHINKQQIMEKMTENLPYGCRANHDMTVLSKKTRHVGGYY